MTGETVDNCTRVDGVRHPDSKLGIKVKTKVFIEVFLKRKVSIVKTFDVE